MKHYLKSLLSVIAICFIFTSAMAEAAVTVNELPVRAVFFPFRESIVSSRVDSVLLKYNYREGERFKAGDVLVKLDSSRYQQVKAQAVARNADILDQIKYFTKIYKSNLDLFNQGMQGEQALAKNKLDMNSNINNMAITQAKLKLAELDLASCNIIAPFDGRMGEKTVQEYEFVRVGQPLFTVVDDNQLLAVVNLAKNILASLTIGKAMRIKLDDVNVECQGKLYAVSAKLDYSSGTVEAKILIDNRKNKLKAGMTGVLIKK
jgi:membrane fusion protein, multidrug efflux system